MWDNTMLDTLASSYVLLSRTLGYAVSRAEILKLRKYADLETSYFVFPLTVETLGGPGPTTRTLLVTVGRFVREATGNPRASEYFLQKLSLDVQRGNAAAVLGNMLAYD